MAATTKDSSSSGYDSKTSDSDTDKLNLPSGWVACEGDTLKTLKEGMNSVKDDFFKVAKEHGFDPASKEYHPTDTGICMLLMGGQHFIGLVKLSKPGLLGGYYASIRVSKVVGTKDEQPFKLTGFLIHVRPWLHFVQSGVFGVFVNENKVSDFNDKTSVLTSDDTKKLIGDSAVIGIGLNGIGTISYASTSFVQGLVNGVKDDIKTKAGITGGELSTFQVTTAAVQNMGSLRMAKFFARIYIGMNDLTQFTNYIYVIFDHSVLGDKSTVTVQTATQFPI